MISDKIICACDESLEHVKRADGHAADLFGLL